MWRSRELTPSVQGKVVYISENEDSKAYTFAFPIVNGCLSLKLLKLSFKNASGISYVDDFYATTENPLKVPLRRGKFQKPEGGWFFKNRRYYVTKKRERKPEDLFAIEMLKRYEALTRGVTIYFDPKKFIPNASEFIGWGRQSTGYVGNDQIASGTNDIITGWKRVPDIAKNLIEIRHFLSTDLSTLEPEVDRVVAAIDFGTSYSGYAYSFESTPDVIYTNEWRAQGLVQATTKAPTTVLLDPEGEFHSFGYAAEDEYALLVDGEVFRNWSYFRNFKMKLYKNKDLRRETLLADVDGKKRIALEIFTLTISRLKKLLLQDVRSKKPELKDDDVTWVVTVPAIWSDAAKQFMREAAVNAGIKGDNLTLVLEPEAASLYCKTREPSELQVICGTRNGNPMGPGKKYILLDLGGGTADMSAHEVLEDRRNLKEIHRATGDSLGGTVIDEQFNKIMAEIVGAEAMLDFFQDYRADYVNFMREFETKKRLPTDYTSNIVFNLPNSLLEMLVDRYHVTIEEAIQQSVHANNVKIRGDKLMFDGHMIELLFKETVDGIVTYIKEIKLDERIHDVDTIILAGGFAKCTHVVRAIKEEFPGSLLITPADPGIAILKGAVLMGHEPERITERVARYTYGVSYARKPFYEGEDPEELKAERNEETYCDGLFEKLVEIGQSVQWGEVFTIHRTSKLNRLNSKFQPLYTKLYASIDSDPEYCTEEENCVKIGEIVRYPPDKGWPDVVKSTIEIKFGETEMTVLIRETTTGVVYKARLDSL